MSTYRQQEHDQLMYYNTQWMLDVHRLQCCRASYNPQVPKVTRVVLGLLICKADNSRNLLIKTTTEPADTQLITSSITKTQ